jgi:hypothetical protein
MAILFDDVAGKNRIKGSPVPAKSLTVMFGLSESLVNDKVVPSKVAFGSDVAVFDVPFAVSILLFVVGDIDVNPAPWAPVAPWAP